jgi:hypothetical protein
VDPKGRKFFLLLLHIYLLAVSHELQNRKKFRNILEFIDFNIFLCCFKLMPPVKVFKYPATKVNCSTAFGCY